ncbi:hypothetical protein RMATCC62417_11752 [Rhizopus microsporus]|nr:hypothetical protein RMATCC62417_11752 [Rhizopus microsporus]
MVDGSSEDVNNKKTVKYINVSLGCAQVLTDQIRAAAEMQAAYDEIPSLDSGNSSTVLNYLQVLSKYRKHCMIIIIMLNSCKALEKYNKECLAPTFKSGRTSIMVWGAIAGGKKSKLVFMKKGMRTSADFINQVYEPVLLDFNKSLDIPVLMKDGTPIHRVKIAAEWREAKGIKKMSWPAQSPDLNPIENLWSIMKKRVNAVYPYTKSQQVVEVVLESVWREFTPEAINKLIDSMPRRVKDVIEARGGPTKY